MNGIVNSKKATKKLQLTHKVLQIHFGNKSSRTCPKLSVHDQDMKTSSFEPYLGDILSNNRIIDLNIQARYRKRVGKINTIFSYL